MRLLHKDFVVGTNLHLSGWPYVMRGLKQLSTDSGILVDDTLEQTMLYNNGGVPAEVQQEDWLAIGHGLPQWRERCLGVPERMRAIQRLRGICTLSTYLAERFEDIWHIPTFVLKYPVNLQVRQFDVDKYCKHPRIVQAGWTKKNLNFIWRIPPTHVRQRLYIQPRPSSYQAIPQGAIYNGVESVPSQDNVAYEDLLVSSVFVAQFLESGTSTLVVEAIAHSTPLLVNRLPNLVEYLGEDYPMFFDDVCECEELLHPNNVSRTHSYLLQMNKDDLSIEHFKERFGEWVSRHE